MEPRRTAGLGSPFSCVVLTLVRVGPGIQHGAGTFISPRGQTRSYGEWAQGVLIKERELATAALRTAMDTPAGASLTRHLYDDGMDLSASRRVDEAAPKPWTSPREFPVAANLVLEVPNHLPIVWHDGLCAWPPPLYVLAGGTRFVGGEDRGSSRRDAAWR